MKCSSEKKHNSFLQQKDILANLELPCLTVLQREFGKKKEEIEKNFAIIHYKQKNPLLWVVFVGGTGTGKSTLFNALCGSFISPSGVERPTTSVPIAFVHKNTFFEEDFPLSGYQIEYRGDKKILSTIIPSHQKRMIVFKHEDDNFSNAVVIDAPDLDSLEHENRQIADDLYGLADIVIFVASQEKYADEVPSRMLRRIVQGEKSYFFLFNKTDIIVKKEEVRDFFITRKIDISLERMWIIPYLPQPKIDGIKTQTEFRDFKSAFLKSLTKDNLYRVLNSGSIIRIEGLKKDLAGILETIHRENTATKKWLKQLETIFDEHFALLLSELEGHFKQENQRHIHQEIQRIYSRYDILSKPRYYFKQLIMTPLYLLGVKKSGERIHQKELTRIRKQLDISPILSTMSRINRTVLENLTPHDTDSLLFSNLHSEKLSLTNQEIQLKIETLQEGLYGWIEEKFKNLARGIPKHKQLGIYSAAILWGGMILSFEVVLGGGITFLEIALDSFLAPLLTKGSVQLFASYELRDIARELDKRYKQGIHDILQEQKDRYRSCMEPFIVPEATIDELYNLVQNLGEKT